MGNKLADNLFEQAVQITKAHGYDILSEQVNELKAENERLKQVIKDRDKRIDELIKLVENFIEKTKPTT